jgi:hypothetical protein
MTSSITRSTRLFSSHQSTILQTISSSFSNSFELIHRNKSILKETFLYLILASLALDLKKEKRCLAVLVSTDSNSTDSISTDSISTDSSSSIKATSITPGDGIY